MNKRCLLLTILVLLLSIIAFGLVVFGVGNAVKLTALGLALFALAAVLKALCCECNPRQTPGSGTVGQTKL